MSEFMIGVPVSEVIRNRVGELEHIVGTSEREIKRLHEITVRYDKKCDVLEQENKRLKYDLKLHQEGGVALENVRLIEEIAKLNSVITDKTKIISKRNAQLLELHELVSSCF